MAGAARETLFDCLGDVFLGESDGSFDDFTFAR